MHTYIVNFAIGLLLMRFAKKAKHRSKINITFEQNKKITTGKPIKWIIRFFVTHFIDIQ